MENPINLANNNSSFNLSTNASAISDIIGFSFFPIIKLNYFHSVCNDYHVPISLDVIDDFVFWIMSTIWHEIIFFFFGWKLSLVWLQWMEQIIGHVHLVKTGHIFIIIIIIYGITSVCRYQIRILAYKYTK